MGIKNGKNNSVIVLSKKWKEVMIIQYEYLFIKNSRKSYTSLYDKFHVLISN